MLKASAVDGPAGSNAPDRRSMIASAITNMSASISLFAYKRAIRVPESSTLLAWCPRPAGPRHIAFHPSQSYAYVIDELDSTVTIHRYQAGGTALQAVQVVPSTPPSRGRDRGLPVGAVCLCLQPRPRQHRDLRRRSCPRHP
jgi:lactonase family protein with 7-bladed beta-propeller